jgi:peptidyl-prolyl cis-trans isomerase D
MLALLRKIATGIVVKLLLVLLIASFALWGVSDVFTKPKAPEPMIKVGSESISADEFSTMYAQSREQMKRSTGGKTLPNETLIRMGLPQQVLDGMVNELLLRQEAAAHGMRVSDAEIVRQTHQNPAFFNAEGRFDRQILRQVLQTLNMSEAKYAEEMRKSEAQRMFGNSLLGLTIVHPALTQSMYLLRQEGRDVDIWVFNQDRVAAPKAPDEKTLAAFYDTVKDEYKTSEMRTVSMVVFDPATVEKTPVTDEQIADEYARNQKNFTQAETRDVEQLIFKEKEDARAAHAILTKGTKWEEVAASAKGVRGQKAQKISSVLKDKALPGTGEAVFSTDVGQFSEAVESPLGWHIFRVETINQPRLRPLEEVKDAIRKTLEANAVHDVMDKQLGLLEDALANGSTLEDAAQVAQVEVKKLPAFDTAGLDLNNKMVAELPTVYGLLDRLFALNKGDTTSALNTEDGKTVVIGITDIALPRHRTLDEVRATITGRWQKEEKARIAQEKAQQIASQDGNVGLEARAAGAFNIPLKDVRRITNVQLRNPADNSTLPMPKEMQDAIFSLRPGQSTKAFLLDTGDAAFAVLNTIRPAPVRMTDKEKSQEAYMATVQAISNEVSADYYNLYINYLKKKFPVKIDQKQYLTIVNPSAVAQTEE